MTRIPTGGPFLEFNFFWADVPLDEAFGRLVHALAGLGAVFRRGGVVVRRTHLGPPTTASPEEVRDVDIAGLGDVDRYAADPDWALATVYMEGATATLSGVAEVVGRGTITPEAALHDPGPLTIYTEGQWTETWIHETKAGERQARTTGRRAKQRFCALIAATGPSYGTITVEDALPTPWAVRQRLDAGAFQNFYLDTGFIGRAAMEQLLGDLDDAYREPVGTGLYVSTWKYFNPKGISLLATARYQCSTQVSQVLAHAAC